MPNHWPLARRCLTGMPGTIMCRFCWNIIGWLQRRPVHVPGMHDFNKNISGVCKSHELPIWHVGWLHVLALGRKRYAEYQNSLKYPRAIHFSPFAVPAFLPKNTILHCIAFPAFAFEYHVFLYCSSRLHRLSRYRQIRFRDSRWRNIWIGGCISPDRRPKCESLSPWGWGQSSWWPQDCYPWSSCQYVWWSGLWLVLHEHTTSKYFVHVTWFRAK